MELPSTAVSWLKNAAEKNPLPLALIAIFLVWRYWNLIASCLSGNESTDKMRAKIISKAWSTLRCGRCSCLKFVGVWLGTVPIKVTIKDIVVGEIKADLDNMFVSVECDGNPPITTSFSKSSSDTVACFQDHLSIQIFDSALQGPMRIVIKQLDTVDNSKVPTSMSEMVTSIFSAARDEEVQTQTITTEVCEIVLKPSFLLQWAREEGPTSEQVARRFLMRQLQDTYAAIPEAELPPWIFFKLYLPAKETDMTKNTTVNVENDNITYPIMDDSSVTSSFTSTKIMFKHAYTPLDTGGDPVQEPDDSRSVTVHRILCFGEVLYCACLVLLLCYFVFLFNVHFMTSSCTSSMQVITTASLKNETFPISSSRLREIKDDCNTRMEGTGIVGGEHICLPTAEQVLATCHELQLSSVQPIPKAPLNLVVEFPDLITDCCRLGDGILTNSRTESGYTYLALAAGGFLVLGSCSFRLALRDCARRAARHQYAQAMQMQTRQTRQTQSKYAQEGYTRQTATQADSYSGYTRQTAAQP